MEDALMIAQGSLTRHHIRVDKNYEKMPPVFVDKYKVLQILLNLMKNAKYACSDSDKADTVITLRTYRGQENMACLEVADNGVGIAPEKLVKVFQHGYTTRHSGHGFGLHSGALAAQELGGSLSVHSDGHGKGAVFTLILPEEKPIH